MLANIASPRVRRVAVVHRGRSRTRMLNVIVVMAASAALMAACSSTSGAAQHAAGNRPGCPPPNVSLTANGAHADSTSAELTADVGSPVGLSVTITDNAGAHMTTATLAVIKPGSVIGVGGSSLSSLSAALPANQLAHSAPASIAAGTQAVSLSYTALAAGEYPIVLIGTFVATCGSGSTQDASTYSSMQRVGTLTVP